MRRFSSDGHSVDLVSITDLLVPMAVIDIDECASANPMLWSPPTTKAMGSQERPVAGRMSRVHDVWMI
jgi:hypothetical protein